MWAVRSVAQWDSWLADQTVETKVEMMVGKTGFQMVELRD